MSAAWDMATKYKFMNIGKASATVTFLALASGPYAAFTIGIVGQILYYALTFFYMMMASMGLVLLNVGVEWIEEQMEKTEFDGSFDDAFKEINEKGSSLSPEDIKRIDDRVASAHTKFGTFARVRDLSDS